jgi:hypothetical protein
VDLVSDLSVPRASLLTASAPQRIAQAHKQEGCEGEGKKASGPSPCGGGGGGEGSEEDRVGAVVGDGLEISCGLEPPAWVEHCSRVRVRGGGGGVRTVGESHRGAVLSSDDVAVTIRDDELKEKIFPSAGGVVSLGDGEGCHGVNQRPSGGILRLSLSGREDGGLHRLEIAEELEVHLLLRGSDLLDGEVVEPGGVVVHQTEVPPGHIEVKFLSVVSQGGGGGREGPA